MTLWAHTHSQQVHAPHAPAAHVSKKSRKRSQESEWSVLLNDQRFSCSRSTARHSIGRVYTRTHVHCYIIDSSFLSCQNTRHLLHHKIAYLRSCFFYSATPSSWPSLMLHPCVHTIYWCTGATMIINSHQLLHGHTLVTLVASLRVTACTVVGAWHLSWSLTCCKLLTQWCRKTIAAVKADA